MRSIKKSFRTAAKDFAKDTLKDLEFQYGESDVSVWHETAAI